MSHLAKTFADSTYQYEIVRGEHFYLHTKCGKRFIDFTSGVTAHSILGYSQASIVEGIKRQAERIGHIDFKTYRDPIREELAELLLSRKKHDLDVFYPVGSSGGEACEAAMKLSYAYHLQRGLSEKNHFISRRQGYHGSTSDSLAIGDRPNLDIFRSFHPSNRHKIPEHNFSRHALPDESEDEYLSRCLEDLKNEIERVGPEKVAAFIGETTLGGLVGDVEPHRNYWREIRKICDEFGVHLIIDEVWCGTGTSGLIYSIDWDDVTPDFIFMGKTLGAGYGAVSGLVTKRVFIEEIKDAFGIIPHSITHQGHTLSCAAAVEAQKIIHNDALLRNVLDRSDQLKNIFSGRLQGHQFFKEIRGRGLRLSLEYKTPDNHWFGTTVAGLARERHGILISGKWHRLGFMPPLIVDKDICDFVAHTICDVFIEVADNFNSFKKSMTFNAAVF